MSAGANWRIPVAAKLFAGFGVVLVLIAAMGWISITRMSALDQGAQRIFEEDLEAIVAVTKIEEEALEVQEKMTKGVLAALMAAEIHESNPAHAAELETAADHFLEEANVEAEDVTVRLEELVASGLLHGALLSTAEEAQHNWGLFLEELDEVNADEDAGLTFEAGEAVLSGEGEVAFALLITEIDEISEELEHEAALSAAEAESTYASARTLMLTFIGIALAAGAAIAFYLARTISNGVGAISSALSTIARGELDAQVSITSNDELGDMSTSYNVMIAKLRDVLGGAADAASTLVTAKDQLESAAAQAATATEEVAKTVGQVAEGTSEQARSVQEVNSGIEQLTASAEELDTKARTEVAESAVRMAEGAKAAADGAGQAAETARKGSDLVQKTVEGIDRIKVAIDGAASEVGELGAQSEEIGKIVSVIEDIAAQTNLLALNAAIEAARAGE